MNEQLQRAPERLASLARADYYSILEDLYRKLNPPAATGLIRAIQESPEPDLEWLDTAIVINQALVKDAAPA